MTKADDPQFTADRLAWQFRRSGGRGEQTGLFSEAPEETRRLVRASAVLEAGEAPAVLFFRDAARWVLLTTASIIDATGGVVVKVPLETVRATRAQIHPRGKLAIDQIVLTIADGAEHVVTVEPGAAAIGFLNAVMAALPPSRSPGAEDETTGVSRG